jgi:hypothetical protein
MSDQEREDRETLIGAQPTGQGDPGAAPGQSDAGSVGRPVGAGLAGVGTGTSIGPSRGNTGPGTGSDAREARYGEDQPTPLTDMLGVAGEDTHTDEGGNAPLRRDPRVVEASQHADPDAARMARETDTGAPTNPRGTAGLGDNDIPAETEVP